MKERPWDAVAVTGDADADADEVITLHRSVYVQNTTSRLPFLFSAIVLSLFSLFVLIF